MTDAERGEALVDYLGVSDTQLASAAERMVADGKHELAAAVLRWAQPRFANSARVDAVRKLVYLRLMEKYQEFTRSSSSCTRGRSRNSPPRSTRRWWQRRACRSRSPGRMPCWRCRMPAIGIALGVEERARRRSVIAQDRGRGAAGGPGGGRSRLGAPGSGPVCLTAHESTVLCLLMKRAFIPLVSGTGTTLDYSFLYRTAPNENGEVQTANVSGGTFIHRIDMVKGPFTAPREVCQAASALAGKTFSAWNSLDSFDCAGVQGPPA